MSSTLMKFSVLDVSMPTYLQDIFRSADIITLVYKKVSSQVSAGAPAPLNTSKDAHDLSLVGNPLGVDLGESLNFEELQVGKRPHYWTREEATFGPIDIKTVREYLNKPLKSSFRVVCLCDVKDPRRTLAVFTEKKKEFYRGTVTFYGTFALNQVEVSFGKMLLLHSRYTSEESQVIVEVNTLFPIIGFNKRQANHIMYKGLGVRNSAFIEVTCPDQAYKSTNNMYKLFLQVNAASPESKFHPLWQQLNIISTFIKELQNEDDLDLIQISQHPKAFHEVADDITALQESLKTKQYVHQGQLEGDNLNVLQMRDEDFLEKLWHCLISLESLCDVRNCFHQLFTDIVETTINYTVPVSNKTTLGVLIAGLIEGKMFVPTLTNAASLKFLIELGLNKLHNDYVFLIRNLEPMGEMHFKQQWEMIAQGSNQISKTAQRKSRMTFAKGSENPADLLKQLNHITNMHLTTEFMYLAVQCKLSGSETLLKVFDSILKCKSFKTSFKTLQQASIVDFECEQLSNQFDLIKDVMAAAINIKFFTQGRDKSTVTTIFHHSDRPIFPDTVFNDYGVNLDKIDENKFYVHMAQIFVN